MNNDSLNTSSESSTPGDIQSEDNYYRSIIENNSFYVIRTDLEGNYSYMNPFFCQQFRLKPADWIGRPSIDLIIPADHQACIETVQQCFMTPGQSHWVILRKPHHSGIVSTQWEFKVVSDDAGIPLHLLCIGHDITSLVMRQQELQTLVEVTADQNKKLLNFTYIISHNIRSHVANIIGIIELNDGGSPEEKEMGWTMMKKSIAGLDTTIHNLNDVINIQTNLNLPIKKVYIREEIEKIIESIRVLFEKDNTTISYDFDEPEFLFTNPAYLESIILNLLTNALKYKSTNRALEIKLAMYTEKQYQVLVFTDNGIGIDLDQNRDKVFGMYKTFHGNADAKGMGLFIIKNQIEALAGKIEIESEVDKFTTFKVFFPLQTE
ncbi:PAS domain S-box-containing protein [Pedobacter westerhofensis]|uniref:histidine kinase n=1 Tax=Pedobacter westerhofensis TaxID=425512 RepID=A0A521AD57_9SPHI|nr:ATP-binding protein [Pedobacter westerhofensis]SMO32630.1 PAS domain S-box-containing protein [Pedobacter westerhofensis]